MPLPIKHPLRTQRVPRSRLGYEARGANQSRDRKGADSAVRLWNPQGR
jgi:hypothetical protein